MRWMFCMVMLGATATAGVANADDHDEAAAPSAADQPQVAFLAELGATGGGGATPGGLRVGGHYLYRLSQHDWFDGGVAFTFGQPRAGCGRVPPDGMRCEHGIIDGFAGDLSLGIRRDLPGKQGFVPFVRGAVFARVLRFGSDDVTGAAAGGELGFGVRAAVRGNLSVVGGATGFAGMARLGNGIGAAGQLGLTIGAGAELRMK